jgi:glutamyl-tRNA synthetase
LASAAAAYRTADWNAAALHLATEGIATQHDLALSKAQAPIRVAITGRTVGPPLFESLEVLGRERAVERIEAATRKMGAEPRR